MKIEKFKKISNGNYKIFLENGDTIKANEDLILNHDLLLKKEIEDVEKLKSISSKYDIHNKTVKYISVRIRSEKEILDYLKKYNLEQSEIEEIVFKLKNINLINDEMFCNAYINDKINLSNVGPSKIISELKKHDIDESIIDKHLNKIDMNKFKEKINNIINKQIKLNNKYSGFKLRNKIYSYLINLGYDYTLINPILNNYNFKDNIDYEKMYNKLYNKYKNKYSEEKLEFVIKQKMYANGWTNNE